MLTTRDLALGSGILMLLSGCGGRVDTPEEGSDPLGGGGIEVSQESSVGGAGAGGAGAGGERTATGGEGPSGGVGAGGAGAGGERTATGGEGPSGGVGAGGESAASGGAQPVCSEHSPMGEFVPATDCTVAERLIDPAITCFGICPIIAASSISCDIDSGVHRILPTTDGAVLQLGHRLITLEAGGHRVEQLPGRKALLASTQSGEPWLIVADDSRLVEMHRAELGWTSGSVREPIDERVSLYDYLVADEHRRHVFGYHAGSFLSSWENGCWRDTLEDFEGWSGTMLGLGAEGNLMLVGNVLDETSSTVELHLRELAYGSDTVLASQSDARSAPWEVFKLVSGTTGPATVMVREDDELRILQQANDGSWQARRLADATSLSYGGEDCPSGTQTMATAYECSAGSVTCQSSSAALAQSPQLLRAASGALVTVWLDYALDHTRVYSEHCSWSTIPNAGPGELMCRCEEDSRHSVGFAEIVVSRVTEAELSPIYLRFPIDTVTGAATSQNLAVTLRGDTLVVSAAFLRTTAGSVDFRDVVYLELDTTQLP